MSGVQVATFLNVAGKVNGYQVGFINLSNEYESGIPIGLVNISRKGSFEGETWVEETGFVFAGLRTGVRWLHSDFAVGIKPNSEQRFLAPTLGVGGEYAFKGLPLFWENDLLYTALFSLDKYPMKNIIIESDWSRVRTGIGYKPLSFLTLVAGLQYNVILHPFSDTPMTGTNYPYFVTFSDQVSMWPGAWVGVRIGK
jgi:hypothetical protein